ncbi:kinase-like protein [Phlegmacium glaucopus]|nr:kinase-like protein [Phlegmacium glaucopus]
MKTLASALTTIANLLKKYKRCHLKPTKRVSLPSNTQSSIPLGCYRVVDFLHTNDFSDVVIARSVAGNKNGSGRKLCCVKIYRHDQCMPRPEDSWPEFLSETKAYQRISEAVQSKLPGFQFLMQLQALRHYGSQSFLVMEVMDCPLRAVIQDLPGALNRVQETKRLVAQMALGLAALHSLGIIHRDFKPENVLIDYRGNVRIADFGWSKIADECAPYLPGRPCTHESVGTWPYIAPEVVENEKKAKRVPYGIEADYWSLGCIVFELESFMFENRAQFDWWCSHEDLDDKQKFLQIEELPPTAFDLICGLVHPDVDKRFGLYEIIHHPYFGKAENSEFYYAQDRALRRSCEGSEEMDVAALGMDGVANASYLYI